MGSTHIDGAAPAGADLAGATEDGVLAEVIRTVALTKVYDGADFAAVDSLDLTVRAGEIFGLLGPNGAGKTTTAGMLTTRVIPSSGEAWIGEVDVISSPALAKQLIGMVSQQNTLDRQLTVWENLYFHGRLFGVSAADSTRIADELLEQFQLAKWAKASVFALSGGMAQRLMVARAIFHRPAVLFLDEPTAGLDPQSRLALWEILGELNRDGQTILLTTHYMEEAKTYVAHHNHRPHRPCLCQRTPFVHLAHPLAQGRPVLRRSRCWVHDVHDDGPTVHGDRQFDLRTREEAPLCRHPRRGRRLDAPVLPMP